MEKLKELIQIAMGEASMCWENVDKAGVFDSSEALRVGDQLLKDIEAELNQKGRKRSEREELQRLLKFCFSLELDGHNNGNLIENEITRRLKELGE